MAPENQEIKAPREFIIFEGFEITRQLIKDKDSLPEDHRKAIEKFLVYINRINESFTRGLRRPYNIFDEWKTLPDIYEHYVKTLIEFDNSPMAKLLDALPKEEKKRLVTGMLDIEEKKAGGS